MARRSFLTIAIVFAGLLLSGCKGKNSGLPDNSPGNAIDSSLGPIDKVLAILGNLSKESVNWRDESNAWRNALSEIEKQAAQDVSNLVKQGETAGNALIAGAPTAMLVPMDALETKFKKHLKVVIENLNTARADIAKEKNAAKRSEAVTKAIKSTLEQLVNMTDDPNVTFINPSVCEAVFKSDGVLSEATPKYIHIHGWGLRRPKDDRFSYRVYLMHDDNKVVEIPAAKLTNNTAYEMHIPFGIIALEYGEAVLQSNKIGLAIVENAGTKQEVEWNSYQASIAITKDPAPPAARKLTKWRLRMKTSTDNKEGRGEVFVRLFQGNTLAAEHGWVGKGENWDNGDDRYVPDWKEFKNAAGVDYVAGERWKLEIEVRSSVPNRQVSWETESFELQLALEGDTDHPLTFPQGGYDFGTPGSATKLYELEVR